MKKLVIILLCLCCGLSALTAQKKTSKVHLKDGTILVGEILEDTDYQIKLKIGTGDVIDVGYKHIDYIGEKPKSIKEKKPVFIHDSGFIYGLSVTPYLSHDRPPSAQALVGYVISKNDHIGLLTRYRTDEYNLQVWSGTQNYLDVGPYYRHFFAGQKRIRPFAEVSGGVTILVAEEVVVDVANDLQPHATLSFGVRVGSSNRLGLTLQAGVSYNKTSFSTLATENPTPFSVTIDYTKEYFTPHITVGMSF